MSLAVPECFTKSIVIPDKDLQPGRPGWSLIYVKGASIYDGRLCTSPTCICLSECPFGTRPEEEKNSSKITT